MANNQLLEEFAAAHPGALQRRLTDVFDQSLPDTDDDAIEALLVELTAVTQEAVDALSGD